MIQIIKKFKPKVIFNLAAETHVDRSIDGPAKFIHTNIVGTFNLLESLRFLQKKKLFRNLFMYLPMKFMVILAKDLDQRKIINTHLVHLIQLQKPVRTT